MIVRYEFEPTKKEQLNSQETSAVFGRSLIKELNFLCNNIDKCKSRAAEQWGVFKSCRVLCRMQHVSNCDNRCLGEILI